ncbi:MAG: transketolase [Bacteroidales bacterium]|nr:transketolase [Bacteroidales bacterium]
MDEIQEIQAFATQVRRDVLRMVHSAKSGHPGGSLGCADFVSVLYKKILKYDSANFTMDGINEDLFFLSNGHVAPVWYSIMARSGFFPIEELSTLRQLGSRLQGHPTNHEGLPGIRIASGSLGQGLSVALGAAQAKKLNNDNRLVFTLHGDGELDEGQIWEALTYGAAKKIDNIISTIDYNQKQIDGPIKEVLDLLDLKAKFIAFGWEVLEMQGNDVANVIAVLEQAITKTGKGKPVAIIMHTEMGAGVDFMMGTHKWHGTTPNDEQLEIALAQLPETLGDY